MNATDMELASKMSQFISRFPEEWQTYQDWLRDITTSHCDLQARYPTWQARFIFRWRLIYFFLYTCSIIAFHRLQHLWCRKRKPLSLGENENVSISRDFFRLHRLATIIAMAELTLCSVAAFTGIMLAFYYEPTALGAHRSLVAIATQISYGSLILSLHDISGNGLIVLALIQIVVMYLGRQFLVPWLAAWFSGLLMALAAIGLSWTAIVLNWNQTGFWRFKIELGTIASLPLVGPGLQSILTGGNGISSLTVQHLYTVHSYILAISGILISITHLTALLYQERTWKSEATESLGRKTTAWNESSSS